MVKNGSKLYGVVNVLHGMLFSLFEGYVRFRECLCEDHVICYANAFVINMMNLLIISAKQSNILYINDLNKSA